MARTYYSNTIEAFHEEDVDSILGKLVRRSGSDVAVDQKRAWVEQITLLKRAVEGYRGAIHLEWSIPRMGKLVDAVLLIGPVVFVVEFKVGQRSFRDQDKRQVTDYALDLKNFHEPSHDRYIAPVLVATNATSSKCQLTFKPYDDKVLRVIECNARSLQPAIKAVLAHVPSSPAIDIWAWERGRYSPTPTLIEAARALYRRHSVSEISRSDASGRQLQRTSETICRIIEQAKAERFKAICVVTGVPGAGKTLIGLNIAARPFGKDYRDRAIFLSGNGPLVKVLTEALARDHSEQQQALGNLITMREARQKTRTFIQNVHHFRDEYVRDLRPPDEHVVIFDEAQRAWNRDQTSKFMRRKRGLHDFNQSEPEFLLSCADRHRDWAVVICLVGSGQEINTGESGIGEWLARAEVVTLSAMAGLLVRAHAGRGTRRGTASGGRPQNLACLD